MGRSVSYPSDATVITFAYNHGELCSVCNGSGAVEDDNGDELTCDECDGQGMSEYADDFDMLIDAFRDQLKVMFPSTVAADFWLDREDHVLAENGLAMFGMSEYCGFVAYWIVPKEYSGPKGEFYYSSDRDISAMSTRWVRSVADKFVKAFGELTKVGSFSNGEGVYRRIDR